MAYSIRSAEGRREEGKEGREIMIGSRGEYRRPNGICRAVIYFGSASIHRDDGREIDRRSLRTDARLLM